MHRRMRVFNEGDVQSFAWSVLIKEILATWLQSVLEDQEVAEVISNMQIGPTIPQDFM